MEDSYGTRRILQPKEDLCEILGVLKGYCYHLELEFTPEALI